MIKQFIKEKIKLNPQRYERMKRQFAEIKEFIESKLEEKYFDSVRIQGSAATKTLIRPREEKDEYDLDIAVVVNERLNKNEHVDFKNNLLEILNAEYPNKVVRHKKCINLKVNQEFNIDLTIMSNFKSTETGEMHQEILNESTYELIPSDNINMVEKFNNAFGFRSDDAIRDLIFLIKFYSRMFIETNKKIPSIGWNCLVVSNLHNVDNPDYRSFLLTTLANVGKVINEKKCFPLLVPFYGKNISTEIFSNSEKENVVKMLDVLRIDLKNSDLKFYGENSSVPNFEIPSVFIQKPYSIK